MSASTIKVFFVLLVLILALGRTAEAAVWLESNKWNQQWENKYSEWIEHELPLDIFVNGRYQNIITDCADAVYIVRAIFAFENRLPFAMLDPTGGSRKITNRMSRFDEVESELGRFHDFANYIADVGDTKSLANDTYPVSISREFIRPGTIWSRPLVTKNNALSIFSGQSVDEPTGHVEIIRAVQADGRIELVGSRLPGAVRNLIWTPFLVFMPVDKTTGFRRWLQPDWYGKDHSTLPGYSVEQYLIGKPYGAERSLPRWSETIRSRLQKNPGS